MAGLAGRDGYEDKDSSPQWGPANSWGWLGGSWGLSFLFLPTLICCELLRGAWGRTRQGSRSCHRKRGHSVPYLLGDLNLNGHAEHGLRDRFLPGKACLVKMSPCYYLSTGKVYLNIGMW